MVFEGWICSIKDPGKLRFGLLRGIGMLASRKLHLFATRVLDFKERIDLRGIEAEIATQLLMGNTEIQYVFAERANA